MAYKDGHYICDQCGAIKTSGNSFGWNVNNSFAICADCLKKRKLMKLQEEELLSAKKERKQLAKEKKAKQARRKQNDSYKTSSNASKVLMVIKWIFFFIWGGPYLLINGIKEKDKIWIIIGGEFTLFLILSMVGLSVFPDGHSLYWINYIFIIPLLLNLIPLIYYVKNY